jgi:hypothetical protein
MKMTTDIQIATLADAHVLAGRHSIIVLVVTPADLGITPGMTDPEEETMLDFFQGTEALAQLNAGARYILSTIPRRNGGPMTGVQERTLRDAYSLAYRNSDTGC